MPTLGTQNISTSYPQLLKTLGLGGVDGNLQVITDGDNTSSALSLSTTGVQSTGSLAVDGTSLLSGVVTFGTSLTASTGTATLGTIASTTINNSGLATVGTLQIGGLAGPKITNVSYGTFAFSGGTVQTHAANDTTTGTFGLPCQLGDIVIASINSLGSTTGTGALISTSFFPIATDVVEYNIIGKGTTAGTIPAGTIFATALRFTA
jgi:serine protease